MYDKPPITTQPRIPRTNLANGIFHGPYPEDPEHLVEYYVSSRESLRLPSYVSDEQLVADIKSEIQYDQHSAAVEQAAEEGLITPEHAVFMLEKILRPWFIGRRNERDIM